jgi:hypothetical protein
MNLSEYADHRGCTRQSVKKAIDENRITAIQKNGRWEIDPTVADEEWNRSTNPRYFEQQGALPANATEYPSINDSRAKHEYYKALLAELAYQSQRQQLVSADEVGREQAKIARTTRELILSIPDRIAHLMAAESDPSAVHALLTAELTNALREVAGEIRQ